MQKHRFFHADRGQFLKEGQEVTLNSDGLSRFGSIYQTAFRKRPEEMNEPEQREFMLELVRLQNPQFVSQRPSRLHCMFAALTIEDVKRFTAVFTDPPKTDVPIYEVFASEFWTFDMNWVDFASDPATRINNIRAYWYGEISNHNPPVGERRAPMLEVLIKPPATIGRVVDWIRHEPIGTE